MDTCKRQIDFIESESCCGENKDRRLPTPVFAQSTLKLHEKEHLHSRWQEPALAGYLNVETPRGELSFKSFFIFSYHFFH